MRKRAGFAVAVLLSAIVATPAHAGEPTATVIDVQITGPVAQRFNLVVLGDGYTAAEQPKFFADVRRHVDTLWSLDPFKSYRSYFNVYAVGITSPSPVWTVTPRSTPRGGTPR